MAGWLQVCSTDAHAKEVDAYLAGVLAGAVAAKMFYRGRCGVLAHGWKAGPMLPDGKQAERRAAERAARKAGKHERLPFTYLAAAMAPFAPPPCLVRHHRQRRQGQKGFVKERSTSMALPAANKFYIDVEALYRLSAPDDAGRDGRSARAGI